MICAICRVYPEAVRACRPLSILGIRYDEPRRWKRAEQTECRTVYPLVDARITLQDIARYWQQAPFDLGLRPDQGNCDLCFLKGQRKLVTLMHEAPERAAWWIAQERFRESTDRTRRDPTTRQFLQRASYTELLRRSQSLLPFPAPEADEAATTSCFCGD